MRKIGSNDEAFTGLEAAIVLIAFVVVAAVFSYVMLGAGFFTSQKSQEVVHTSVAQTSSSVDVAGTVIGQGNAAKKIENVTFTLQLTAGGSPADTSKIIYSVINSTSAKTYEAKNLKMKWVKHLDGATADNLLENGEMVEIQVPVFAPVNERFVIDVKPALGAALPIVRHAPPGITNGEYYDLV